MKFTRLTEAEQAGKSACCYYNCPELGLVHIKTNGGDSHWICCLHLDHWNASRARFLADGGRCEMEQLGEPVCEDRRERSS